MVMSVPWNGFIIILDNTYLKCKDRVNFADKLSQGRWVNRKCTFGYNASGVKL